MKPERNKPCPCGSGIKYKNCCNPTGIEVINFYKSLDSISSGYTPISILNLFQNISRDIKGDYFIEYKDFKLTNFYLNFIFLFLIKNSDENGKELNQKDFDEILEVALDIPYDSDQLNYELSKQNYKYFIKSGFLQFHYNKPPIGFLGRLMLFYSSFKDQNQENFSKFLELKNKLEEKLGISIEHFFFIGFSIYFLINKMNLNIENILRSPNEKLKNYLTKENLEKFLAITSTDYVSIVSELKQKKI